MISRSALDAIIIADSGVDTLSGTNPLKLHLNGRVGDIQVIKNYIHNNGAIIPPVKGNGHHSWVSAPKLNGIYLTSYLTRNNFNIELVHNFTAEKDRFTALLANNPKSIIISTSFIFFKKALNKLVNEIRILAPDICIIAGGPFVNYSYLLASRSNEKEYETTLPADDFLFLKVDNEPDVNLYIISPKGEHTLCQVLQKLQDGLPIKGTENTATLSGNSYTFGHIQGNISGDTHNTVDWELLPTSFFESGVIPLQASNGCPYNCSFCNFTKDQRINYIKPLEQLSEELKIVQRKGVKYVWFVDDNFRLGRNDLESVCKRFINDGIQVKWMCFMRACTLQNTDINLLRQAGCIELQIGLESGDSTILDNMNKKSDPAMYQEVIKKVLNHGINVSCYFITGFPGETESSAATTREFIRKIENPEAEGSLSWSIYPFLLSPLSPIYEPAMRKKFGLTGYFNSWKHATMDFNGAKQLALKAFLELENSGQIYRGDNLDILFDLSGQKRKEFHRTRHLLAKKSIKRALNPEDIIQSFRGILV